MDDLFEKALPTYSPEEQETLRGIQDQIKHCTQAGGLSRDVQSLEAEVSSLEMESEALDRKLNPTLPPNDIMMQVQMEQLLLEDATLAFTDAEAWLRKLLADAKRARSRLQELTETVAAQKRELEEIELQRQQTQSAWEEFAKLKDEADEISKQADNIETEVRALEAQCEDVEKRIQVKLNPSAALLSEIEEPLAMLEVTEYDDDYCGLSRAEAVRMELEKATRACEEERGRAQLARKRIIEFTASKDKYQTRLQNLKSRLTKIIANHHLQRDDGKVGRDVLIQLLRDLAGDTDGGAQMHHLVNSFSSDSEAIHFDAFVDWLEGSSAA